MPAPILGICSSSFKDHTGFSPPAPLPLKLPVWISPCNKHLRLAGSRAQRGEGDFVFMEQEVMIVGGGPAGLSAALILGRARRKVLVLDSGTYRNARSRALHGFLTREGISPADFLTLAREELQRYPTVEVRNARVEDVRR
ncbi:MAG: NAD(P)/FAD-dependent oxidoreductase [Proteobacteria bacterium]|nr:MAG: NAD(P)/FAD-dependent oxidoreductase [Pseudomonadota bacterium]